MSPEGQAAEELFRKDILKRSMEGKGFAGGVFGEETMDSSERSLDRFCWINMTKELLNLLRILINLLKMRMTLKAEVISGPRTLFESSGNTTATKHLT